MTSWPKRRRLAGLASLFTITDSPEDEED